MGALLLGFGSILGVFASKLLPRVLASMGLGVVVFTGLNTALTAIFDFMVSQFSGLPAAILYGFQLAQVDTYFTMVTSAHIAVLAIKQTLNIYKISTS